MNMQTPSNFSGVILVGVWCCAGLCLRTAVVVLGKLLAFLAYSPYLTRAGSSGFRSSWPVWSCSFSYAGSNPALKPTSPSVIGLASSLAKVRFGSKAAVYKWWLSTLNRRTNLNIDFILKKLAIVAMVFGQALVDKLIF